MIRRLKLNVIFAQALYRYQEETGQLRIRTQETDSPFDKQAL
jgi:hypothetical protein